MAGNTVTFPTDLGGSGATYTDDDDALTGLGNGGYLTRLLPMLSQATVMARTATNSAAAAVNAPGTSATSSTSLTIGTGSKSFTLAQTGKQFALGQNVVVANTASPANNMVGTITAFDPNSGAMTVSVSTTSGSGTFTAWTISLSGPGFTGGKLTTPMNDADTVTLASAATVNIGAGASNSQIISGAVTITAFDSIAAGAERELTFSGAPLLTHNGTSLILPGGKNIQAAAGDVATFRSLGSGNWRCVKYLPGAKSPVTSPSVLTKTADFTATQAEVGRAIEYTGAGGVTLTLTAPASLAADWNIGFRNDATDKVIIAPASGTIDGKASIWAWPGEGFLILAVGSNFITLGRAKRVLAATTALSGLTAANYETMFSDPELVSIEWEIVEAAGPNGVQVRFKASGAYLTSASYSWNGEPNNNSQTEISLSGGGATSATSRILNPTATSPRLASVIFNNGGTSTSFAMTGSYNSGITLQGVQFLTGGSAFTGGTIRCYVRRD
jgi:hypothetical protein